MLPVDRAARGMADKPVIHLECELADDGALAKARPVHRLLNL